MPCPQGTPTLLLGVQPHSPLPPQGRLDGEGPALTLPGGTRGPQRLEGSLGGFGSRRQVEGPPPPVSLPRWPGICPA